MLSILHRFFFVSALACGCMAVPAQAASPVWKVTGPNGSTLYLGGSIHALSEHDYPLPPAFNRAFDASNRIAFEITPRDLDAFSSSLDKAGEYPKADNLKNHVDPRTYDYLRRFFKLLGVQEKAFSRYRPWFISLALETPSLHGLSSDLGVEEYLTKRAKANNKPISGLESSREHMVIFSGLSDRQSEALLLLTFIPSSGPAYRESTTDLWRHGDADAIAHRTLNSFSDFPGFGQRLINARNHNWIPKIEGYLRSGKIYFVVAGAAHMGGSEGVIPLLRAKGYRIEQM